VNIFIQVLASESIDQAPDLKPTKLQIEDNIGEGIHIILRILRLEMSLDEFDQFADAVDEANTQLEHGDC